MVDGGVLTLLLISFESDKIVTRENLSMISPLKLPYYVMIFLTFWIQILFQFLRLKSHQCSEAIHSKP